MVSAFRRSAMTTECHRASLGCQAIRKNIRPARPDQTRSRTGKANGVAYL
jgi:hypothetical protein